MRIFILLFAVSASISPIHADQWSDQMFSTRKIDFGVIATNSESIQRVEIKNVHSQSIHVESITTSCTCASGKMEDDQHSIPPGGSAFINVRMDTERHRQKKESNLIVRFNSPRYAEHRIPIEAYIRTDVVFSPGKVKFNTVEYGQAATAVVNIAYAGRPDWSIEDIKFDNENMKAKLSAPDRSSPGLLKFQLTMTLNDKARVGQLRDVVTIVTNDRTNPYIPLLVEGAVAPDIAVSPSVLRVGSIPSGRSANVKLLLRGKKPFIISGVDCEGMSGCFKAELADTPKNLQQIVVEFTPPNRPGAFTEELLVNIKDRAEPLRLNISGNITN